MVETLADADFPDHLSRSSRHNLSLVVVDIAKAGGTDEGGNEMAASFRH
jgi:hypothetical protein